MLVTVRQPFRCSRETNLKLPERNLGFGVIVADVI